YADWNNIITKTHDVRADSSVSYYKALGAANFSVMYAGGEDTPANDNAGAIISGAVEVKSGDLVLAFAYQDIDEVPAPLPVAPATNAAKGVIGYTLGATSVGFAIERVDTTGSPNLTNTMLSVKHKLNDDNTIKFAFGEAEDAAGGINDPTMMALGLDHKLSSSTTAFVYWADGDNGGLASDAKLVGDSRVIAVGAIVKF
ncbi:MAG: porin, partial [Gammaproteobacteria bacterium]|nr:porin [Gammaproteobacteria bacterium]